MIKSKISTLHAIFLVLTIVSPYVISALPRTMVNECKSSTLLNVFYVTLIVLLFILIMCKLLKNFPSCDILDISLYIGGKTFEKIIGFIFIFYFCISSAMLLRNFCESLTVVYYPLTNYIFLIFLFILSLLLTNNLSFNAISNVIFIIFPIIFISIITLFFCNIKHFSFYKIFPLLGTGSKQTFLLGLSNIGAFGEICYLFFLPPILQKKSNFRKISILSTIFTGIFICFCCATLLLMFSFFETTNEVMPLFSAARYIEFGTFFQRFESIFLLIWIISFCCGLCISCKFCTMIFKKIFNLSDPKQIGFIFIFLIFSISLLPKNYAISIGFETDFYRTFRIIIGFILTLFILILANIKLKNTKSY